ncbi:MAG: four helix bundle protein [Deltaproteobacteria bacterium]|nr:four helix bundle protein [Deltaproteobacteria bacterium]
MHIEKIGRSFSRYHKYTLGTDLRNKTRAVLEKIIEANDTPDLTEYLMGLRQQLENLKVLFRLRHDIKPAASVEIRQPYPDNFFLPWCIFFPICG